MRKFFTPGRRIVEAMFFVGAALVIGSLLWRYDLYRQFLLRPSTPVEAAGQIVPYSVRDKIIYITREEDLYDKLVVVAQIAGFVLFALFIWLSRHRQR